MTIKGHVPQVEEEKEKCDMYQGVINMVLRNTGP